MMNDLIYERTTHAWSDIQSRAAESENPIYTATKGR